MDFESELAAELRSLEDGGLRRRLRTVDGPQREVLTLDGRAVINFSSNNYLGLAADPVIVEAAWRASAEVGHGAGASRLIAGNLRAHVRLEQALASFHGRPAALLFNSGYQANVGALQALAGPRDLIFSDELNHASLIDGCRLSRARTVVYRHADLDHLAALLDSMPAEGRRLVVTDSIFSMDGDVAPLPALRSLCSERGVVLIVDEAHATGVLGPRGQGVCAREGVVPDVHLATLSKAFGSFGAYATGSRALIDILVHKARSFVFTTALPPGIVAGAEAALALLAGAEGEKRRAALGERTGQFAAGLQRLGLLAPGAGATPIFPIFLGDPGRAMEAMQGLLNKGIYAQGIRPPTVPRGTSRLRFALMATHTAAHVDQALAALEALGLPRVPH